MSILDTNKIITPGWLKENGRLKIPSFTTERNPWWTKIFNGLSPNGGTHDIVFAYNDETMNIHHRKGFPYSEMSVVDTSDVELFIKTQLENYTPIQYLGRTYLIEKTH